MLHCRKLEEKKQLKAEKAVSASKPRNNGEKSPSKHDTISKKIASSTASKLSKSTSTKPGQPAVKPKSTNRTTSTKAKPATDVNKKEPTNVST